MDGAEVSPRLTHPILNRTFSVASKKKFVCLSTRETIIANNKNYVLGKANEDVTEIP